MSGLYGPLWFLKEIKLVKLMKLRLTDSFAIVRFWIDQFAFNTLGRVNPVSHGVCNVVKRIAIIGSSVMFFGNKLTMQTKIGTAIALMGTALYTELKNRESKK